MQAGVEIAPSDKVPAQASAAAMRLPALLWPELAPTIELLHRASLMSDSIPFRPLAPELAIQDWAAEAAAPP